MEEGWKICGLKINLSDTNLYVVLTGEGANGIKNAKKYSENVNLASPGFGRPVVSDREKVFQQMIEYLRANDEEQITLNDLKELVDPFLTDSPHKAFTTKWIKHKS